MAYGLKASSCDPLSHQLWSNDHVEGHISYEGGWVNFGLGMGIRGLKGWKYPSLT